MSAKKVLIIFVAVLLSRFLPFVTVAQADDLQDALSTLQQESIAKTPPEKVAIMKQSLDALKASQIIERAPRVGQSLPDGKLLNVYGSPVRLHQIIGDRPAIVTFYRGGWCPYCNLQLLSYAKHIPEIEQLGATLVAISPELPDNALTTKQKGELKFAVLSDSGNQYARSLGIVYHVDDSLKAIYQQFGLDLEKNQGNDSWDLPLAATFVIDRARIIRYAFVDVDYKKRAAPSTLLNVLRQQEK